MPFTDTTPASWLGAGYNTQSGKIELNTNSATVNKLLVELTDAEADENSGDIRKLMFGIIEGLFIQLRSKNASLAPADRPVNMNFTRGTNINEATGILTRQYTFTFQLEAASVEVANEPV